MVSVRPVVGYCILLALFVSSSGPAFSAERPNFVFIYTDDQRWDALGCVQREQGDRGRFPWLESPHLDQLAAEGVRFRNAFVVTALCAPSRAAFLTGQYGHRNGVINNHTPFPVQSVTHASLMRAAGYRTGYVGKWHMGNQSGQRPGFDFSASFVGQGAYFDCPIEVNGVKTPSHGWVDDVSTDYAIKFITENKDQAFSLVLGYKSCHGPFTPPPRMQNQYADAQARSVPNLSVPAIYKDDGGTATRPQAGPVETTRTKTEAMSATVKTNLGMFRGLKAIDENVGKVLATLDQLGLSENTVVVYSSDNGYYLGEHGLGDKRSAYEESIRVPLLMRYPKLVAKGQTIDGLVLNIDLAPTWLDLAGLPIPEEMQGRSWKPLLMGNAATVEWRQAFLYSYFRETPFAIPSVVAVRTDSAKLVKYPGRDLWTEVFDLKSDPYEVKNLFGAVNHAALTTSLEAEFQRQVQATGYHVPDYADEKQPVGVPGIVAPRTKVNGWVLDYQFNRDTGDRIVDASGQKNSGQATGTKLVTGRDGQPAREFDGQGHIDVPKSGSLDPSRTALTIEAVLRPTDDGVVLAHGGQSLGYLLEIKNGRPVFSYRSRSGVVAVVGKMQIRDEWTTILVRITPEGQILLQVNGKADNEGTLKELIARSPNDGLQIGADLQSFVAGQELPKFRGKMQRIRIGVGDVKP